MRCPSFKIFAFIILACLICSFSKPAAVIGSSLTSISSPYLFCNARGGEITVLIYHYGKFFAQKKLCNTFSQIPLPFDGTCVIINWREQVSLDLKIFGYTLEVLGIKGALILSKDTIKASTNLLRDPRSYLKIDGIRCKDPSIIYYTT